ncbi:MAG: DUF5131 family protein [Eubacteriaceae bacterium]|nr:DUF5131 family protein [Eubacteriaceae bacterium]
MNRTKIEWADRTWNPVTGCRNGCPYCYARRIARRFGGASETFNTEAGLEYDFVTEADGTLHDLSAPIYDTDHGRQAPFPYEFDPTLHEYRLDQPSKTKRPKNVFVCSMADLFGPWIPDEWIRKVFEACEQAPQHKYMFLTKFPERVGELTHKGQLPTGDNYWWGSTITDNNSRRYPGCLGQKTYLSIEPLRERLDVGLGSFGSTDWIIIGAETGPKTRKGRPEKEWIDTICDAAAITHTPVFMKNSLIEIMGEENMRREFPPELKEAQDE